MGIENIHNDDESQQQQYDDVSSSPSLQQPSIKAVIIPYQEVQMETTKLDNDLTLPSTESSPERPTGQANGCNKDFVIENREYRTARHMALMEKRVARKNNFQ